MVSASLFIGLTTRSLGVLLVCLLLTARGGKWQSLLFCYFVFHVRVIV